MTCQFCGGESRYLCDHILGWDEDRTMHTCDAPLCESCRTQTGIITLNGVDSIDKCPIHRTSLNAQLDTKMTATNAEAIRRRNSFKVIH